MQFYTMHPHRNKPSQPRTFTLWLVYMLIEIKSIPNVVVVASQIADCHCNLVFLGVARWVLGQLSLKFYCGLRLGEVSPLLLDK